ncbi:uncharacterized protein LOC119550566 [Drosophila subpulchrella]|uniref:uncharacterized protein LOC119550566 n=1 Tax=Drosophila subpulchrella TaxID=1486046 RepID=UPI0018A1774A|nr:uncharacterized protein LOC119550566 [Drosophila subpulchrella]
MDFLSKLLLIAGLLMLSWQWTVAMPNVPKNQPGGVSISQPDLPLVDNSAILVQSIFNIDPSLCPKGYVRVGPHNTCRKEV